MHLEGSHSFAATPERLWELLSDPEVLARATPGLKSLTPDGEGPDDYRAEFHIKIGPVNGGFSGRMAVRDKEIPRGYRLEVEVGGRVGAAKAEGTFEIRPGQDGTVVAFAGDARLSGVLARMGGRVLSGVARQFTKQFFEALEREI